MRLVIAATIAILTATASAQPSLTLPAEPPPHEYVIHYRVLTLAADATSIGMFVAGMAAEGPNGRDTEASSDLMAAGMLGGFFASPLIHAGRGHYGRAVGSFVLRSGLASVGIVVGVSTASCTPNEWFCGFDRIGPGMLVGLAGASLIDAAFMTEESSKEPAWTPLLAARRGGGTIGFATRF